MAAQVAAFMQRLLNFFHCNTLLQDSFEQFRLSIPDASCLTNGIFFGKLLLKGFSYFQDWGYTEKKKKQLRKQTTVSHEELKRFHKVEQELQQ